MLARLDKLDEAVAAARDGTRRLPGSGSSRCSTGTPRSWSCPPIAGWGTERSPVVAEVPVTTGGRVEPGAVLAVIAPA
jgi:hypothetical protein